MGAADRVTVITLVSSCCLRPFRSIHSRMLRAALLTVLAVYARETGQGMVLPEEAVAAPASSVDTPATATPTPAPAAVPDASEPPPDGPASPPGPGKRPHLRVVK